MRDALVDAFGDRPTIGALRGKRVLTAVSPFDWDAVKRRVDEEHAAEIERVLNPSRSQQRPRNRLAFSVVTGDELLARTRNRTYGVAVLDAECWRVARTPAGNRNNTLASAAFKVGRGAVGPGYLDHDEAFANLLGAALDCGLSEREARPVIRSGIRAGARHPRDAA
jgi:hypothetical protein